MAQAQAGIYPDAIYFNGKVATVNSKFAIVQAFAVLGDKFVAVGTNAEIQALAGPRDGIGHELDRPSGGASQPSRRGDADSRRAVPRRRRSGCDLAHADIASRVGTDGCSRRSFGRVADARLSHLTVRCIT